MPDKNLIQKLDWILNAINDNVANQEILDAYNWNIDELREILEKLSRDGYIKRIRKGTNEHENIPTVEGRLFIGYEKQQIIDGRNEKRIIRNEKLLIYGTWFAGIAAILLLLWQIFVWINPVYAHFPYILFGAVRK